ENSFLSTGRYFLPPVDWSLVLCHTPFLTSSYELIQYVCLAPFKEAARKYAIFPASVRFVVLKFGICVIALLRGDVMFPAPPKARGYRISAPPPAGELL